MKCKLALFLFITQLTVVAAEPTYRKWKDEFNSNRLEGAESYFIGDTVPTYQDIFTLHLVGNVRNDFTLRISPTRQSILIQIKTPKNSMESGSRFFSGTVNLCYVDDHGGEVSNEYFSFCFTNPNQKMFLRIPTSLGVIADARAYYIDCHGFYSIMQWKDLTQKDLLLEATGTKKWFFRSMVVNAVALVSDPGRARLKSEVASFGVIRFPNPMYDSALHKALAAPKRDQKPFYSSTNPFFEEETGNDEDALGYVPDEADE